MTSVENVVERLNALGDAYPEDVFPDFTKEFSAEYREEHSRLITLVSAAFGRHLSERIKEAADLIERQEARIAEMGRELAEARACIGTIRGLTGCVDRNVTDVSVEQHSREIMARFDALRKYAGHYDSCSGMRPDKCDCGYSAALDAERGSTAGHSGEGKP